MLAALRLTAPTDTKLLILGQDPYHTAGVAHGLAFSSRLGMTPSLEIIFKELERTGYHRTNPNLTDWATQGVLLLNTILTTRRGLSLAHQHFGWQDFTAAVVRHLVQLRQPLVVLLWGRVAHDFYFDATAGYPFDRGNIQVLQSYHPVAEKRSGGRLKFTGCNHFVLANEWLQARGITPINWNDHE